MKIPKLGPMSGVLLLLELGLLSGCNGTGLSGKQKAEVEDISADVANDVISENDQIDELESRLEKLEAKFHS